MDQDLRVGQVWRAERTFEGMLAECLSRPPGGVVIPPLVVEGMVAGVAHITRSRLLAGEVEQLPEVGDEVTQWALSYVDEAAARLDYLDRQSVWRNTMLEPRGDTSTTEGEETWLPAGDRALILVAVAELAVAKGYGYLTAPRVRSAAGVSRRKFDAYFDSVEECFLAALELKVSEVIAHAARAQTAARSWAGGVYRAISALCEYTGHDPFLARVCLSDNLPSGQGGARLRRRLGAAVAEQIGGGIPREARPGGLVIDASTGAVWAVFLHRLLRERALQRQISATLSYLALAPAVGAAPAVDAIRGEQVV